MTADVSAEPGGALSTELAEIEGEMAVAGSRYWRDPERQERYRELVTAREAHRAAPAAQPGRGAELRQIEELMRDSKSAYWRGPRSEALQARYRALLEGAAPAPTADRHPQADLSPERPGDDAWRGSLDDIRAEFGFPEELDTEDEAEEAELQAELHRAQDGAAAIVTALGETDGFDLAHYFNTLPDGPRAACLAALARFEPGYVKPADAGELAAFRADQSCGGAALVAHWGAAAGRRLGIAMEAFNGARGLIGDDDRADFDDWWGGLPPRQRQIILWRLGEPQ